MDDQSPNPFDQIDPSEKDIGYAQPAPPAKNAFDSIDPNTPEAPESSATGALFRGAERSAVPALGSLPAIGAGVEAGAELGTAVAGPPGAFFGGIGGGLLGGILGSTALSSAQDWALSKLPDSWREAIGLDDRQEKIDQAAHGTASFIGGLAPFALTMRPGGWTKAVADLPDNATAFKRLMAHPATAHVFGGAIMGGMELGQEVGHGENPNWTNVAISTGFGVVWNKPTRFGETLTEIGAQPARRMTGRPEPTLEPTIAQAGDAKVIGPGVTEAVFQGTERQAPQAAMTAQEAARLEEVMLGKPKAQPDVHLIARGMNPDTFKTYDDLIARKAEFEKWVEEAQAPREGAEPALFDRGAAMVAAQQHLAATNAEINALAPEIAASYRRAAEAMGSQTVEPEAVADGYRTAPATEIAGETHTVEAQRAFISNDITQKLVAAGRPWDEARATGQLVAARYETRANRLGGAAGTPEELYRAEAPEIRGAGPSGPVAPQLPLVAGRPIPEAAAGTDHESLRTLLLSGASPETISAHPYMQAGVQRMQEIPPTTELPGYGTPEFEASREFDIGGKKVTGYDKAIDHLSGVAEAYAGGPVKAEHQAYVIIGPSASGKSRLSERIAKHEGAAIVDSDDAKKIIPQFENGVGSSGVHDESTDLAARVLDKHEKLGTNIVVPRVGQRQETIQALMDDFKAHGYDVHLVNLAIQPDEAFRRMTSRYLKTGRLINPTYFHAIDNLPTQTYNALKGGEGVSSYANVDVNGPPGTENITESTGRAKEALSVAGRGIGAAGSAHAPTGAAEGGEGSAGANAVTVSALSFPEEVQAAVAETQAKAANLSIEVPQFTPATDAAAKPQAEGAPAGTFMFDPTQLNVDAERFQFKSGGDKYGVTGALRSVSKWDPAKAQAIIVWEQNDGKLYVADGHQRAGLARRLTEEGKAANVQLPGLLFREKDGISADDVRAIAAVTNIANGSGSALDGAKILRARPDLLDGSVPITAGKGAQAANLAKLDDEAFRMVVNDVVPENFGAVVGELIPRDGPRQVAAMKAIARFEPRNVEEASVLTQRVAQAELARTEEGRQTSMFGDLETPESTAGEEMKIVGRAIKDLQKDKALFTRVVANAERIEESGSTIQREAAKGVASDAALFARTLASDAYSAGPLRQEVKAAAKDLKDGKASIGEASTRILAALRGTVEENGARRARDLELAQQEAAPQGQELFQRRQEPVAAPSAEYEAAYQKWKIESAKWRQAQADYRSRKTGDKEFLASKAEFNQAQQELDRAEALKTEPGAEGLPQTLVPGFEPVGRARPFAREEMFQGAQGKIRLAEGARPIITLMRDANASTFIHEAGHAFLEELKRDTAHPAATEQLKADFETAKAWMGVGPDGEIKVRHHEKFARGFEQYLREGIAPSPGLASVFAKFKTWLLQIYQTIKGLGKPINEDIRGVFDRLLAEEPQRTVIAGEHPGGPSLADIHETDARETLPEEAEAAARRVKAERELAGANPPPEIANEIAPALAEIETARAEAAGQTAGAGGEPGREPIGGVGGHGEVAGGGLEAGTKPAGGGVGEGAGEKRAGGNEPVAESGAAGGAPRSSANEHPLAPRPGDLFGRAESPFIDKAGNIRLDTLTTSQEVAQAIRDAADANNDFIGDRRGVITDGQAMELAEDIGMEGAWQLVKQRAEGQAFNAEQVLALRMLLRQSAATVSEAMKKAAIGTDEDVMAYAVAKDRHQMIQSRLAGVTAEAGRALRAFHNIAGTEEGAAVDQFIKQATGKTLFQLKQEAKLGAQLQTTQQISKFMEDAKKRSFGRMILEYWINGLISGPSTHATYMVGNELLSLEKAVPETAAAAFIGRIREAMGRPGETVKFGEVTAQLQAHLAATPTAIKAAAEAFQRGVPTQLPGETTGQVQMPFAPQGAITPAMLDEAATVRDAAASVFGIFRGARDGIMAGSALIKAGGVQGAPMWGPHYTALGAIPDIAYRGVPVIPVGSTIRVPGRFIAAIHSFFRATTYSMAKAGDAYHVASNDGLSGTAFDARAADVRQNPTQQQMEKYTATATELALMSRGGPMLQKISSLFNTSVDLPILGDTPILKFIDPFVHISGNILNQTLVQRTPLGILAPTIRADLMGRNGNVAQDMAMARMAVGTILSVTFGGLAAEGYISGSGPTDPNEARLWRMPGSGHQAHSVRIGDLWYDMHRLGPMGLLMGVSADLYDVAHAISSGDALEAAHTLIHGMAQNILDESFMHGPAELIKALENDSQFGAAWVRNQISSFVPFSVGLAQMDRAADPYTRQARTIMDAIRAKIPPGTPVLSNILGSSTDLFPKRDGWGEPIPNKEALVAKGVTAIYEASALQDPVNKAMLNLGLGITNVPRKIRNIELTDQQYDDFARISGRLAKQRLDAIVRSPDWQTFPNESKHATIEAVIKASRTTAEGYVMSRDPTIPVRAYADKMKKLHGTPIE